MSFECHRLAGARVRIEALSGETALRLAAGRPLPVNPEVTVETAIAM